MVLPLSSGVMAIQAHSIQDWTIQRSLWMGSAILGLFSLWLIRKTWNSWRYHREQDARPTHGLYVVPGALLIRCPAQSRPGAQLPLEWQSIPMEESETSKLNLKIWAVGRNVVLYGTRNWNSLFPPIPANDSSNQGLPDFQEHGPVQTALKNGSNKLAKSNIGRAKN